MDKDTLIFVLAIAALVIGCMIRGAIALKSLKVFIIFSIIAIDLAVPYALALFNAPYWSYIILALVFNVLPVSCIIIARKKGINIAARLKRLYGYTHLWGVDAEKVPQNREQRRSSK